MDNSALAGYAIGSWLKNYIDRGQMRTQRERLLAGQANTNSTQSTNMPDVANTPGYGQATADTLSFGPLSKLAEVTQQSAAQQPTAQPDVSSMQGYGQATPQTLSLGGSTADDSGDIGQCFGYGWQDCTECQRAATANRYHLIYPGPAAGTE